MIRALLPAAFKPSLWHSNALIAFSLLLSAVPSGRAETVSAPGPGPTPIGRYLLTAKEDGALRARQADLDLGYGAYSGLPLLRDVEFRVRNDALDPENMRYTLRLEPRGFGEGRASRRYNQAQVKRSRQRERLLLNRALLDRYLFAIDLLMKQELHRLYGEMFAVAEDRIKVLESRKTSTDFDLADLIEAEADLTKLRSQDLDVQKDIDLLRHRIGLQLGGGPFAGFDTAALVDVETLIAETGKGGFQVDTSHVYLEYLKQGLALAENRYRMEKAEGRQYLSFLSFSYDMGERIEEMGRRDEGKDYDLGRAYILEAGFRLPGLTTGNQDLNRRKEELLSEKEDYQEKKRELEEMMGKDIEDIHSLVIQYRYLKARESEVDAQASLKKYIQVGGADPLLLLSIKAANLKNSLRLEEVKYGIIMNYVKVMDATGRLSREPLRNFLAADVGVLAP